MTEKKKMQIKEYMDDLIDVHEILLERIGDEDFRKNKKPLKLLNTLHRYKEFHLWDSKEGEAIKIAAFVTGSLLYCVEHDEKFNKWQITYRGYIFFELVKKRGYIE